MLSLFFKPKILYHQYAHFFPNRYAFDASKIAALKAKAASTSVQQPTRVEAVSALLWKCAVKASSRLRSGGLQQRRLSVLFWAANIRPRLMPPLSEHSFGNLIAPLAATDDGSTDHDRLSSFVCHLRKQSLEFKNKYLSKLKEDGGEENDSVILDLFGEVVKKQRLAEDVDQLYVHTSYCKFRFYDIDFGWGKPAWVRMGDALCVPNYAMFADARDGEGVEAWVNFAKEEDMALFERDSEFLEFASINPSPLQQY